MADPIKAGALATLITNTLIGAELAIFAEMIGILTKQPLHPKQVLEAVAATPYGTGISREARSRC